MSTEHIVQKVQKLLRLAESPNLNEARNAASAAQRLMTEHRPKAVDVEEGDGGQGIEEVQVDERSSGSAWRWRLLWVLCKANGCRPWTRPNDGRERYVVFGAPASADTVRYMFRLVERAIEDEVARRRRAGTLWGRSECHAFRVAAITAVQARLNAVVEEVAQRSADTTALARLDAEGGRVQDYMREDLGLTYGRSRRTRVGSARAYAAGDEFGRSVSLDAGGRPLGGAPRALPE